MEDSHSNKLIPSSNVKPTIHSLFPIEKVSYMDHSIEKINPCVIYPESVDLNNLSNIEFIIHESSGYYLDLTSFRLEVKLQLLDENGLRDGIAADTGAYFINNLLNSLFPITKCYINNENVETNYHSGHIARLSMLQDTDNSIIEQRGKTHGTFTTTPAQKAATIADAQIVANVERKTFSKQNVIHLKGYLNLDICSSNKWLLDQCNVRIVLESARNSYLINAVNNDTAFRKNIQSIRLHCNRIKPTPGGFINTTKYLQNHNMEYIYKKNVVHTEILAANQTSLTISRPFNNRVPHKLHIFMNSQASEAGAYNLDPHFYNTNNLDNYRIMLNGEVLKDIDCSEAEGYVNVYADSLREHSSEDTFIPYNMYTKGGFVITVSTNSSGPGMLSYEQKGNLDIHLRFAQPIAHTQIVYVVGVVHTTYEITSDRNCISNYGY